MTGQPILFVAGLGRCGTTMMMAMLDAGGFPVIGPRPAYETPERWRGLRPDMDWLRSQGGRAVKWLDPTRCPTLLGRLNPQAVVILMTRDPREQARSQVKMATAGTGLVLGRRGVKAMERSIRRDMPIMRAQMRGRAAVHEFRFEDVLASPLSAAAQLSGIVDRHFRARFGVVDAERTIIKRAPECLPHMYMESAILPLLADRLGEQQCVS